MTKLLIMTCVVGVVACGAAGTSGVDGDDGSGCTVDVDQLVCDDGTRYDLDSEDGTTGVPGDPGVDGAPGADGVDGTSCTVTDTPEGARIDCDDGTSAVLKDGVDGVDGVDGTDGAYGATGPTGAGASLSGDRLEVVSLVGEDGSAYSSGVYWDTGMEAFCEPKRHADGAMRCIPIYQATVSDLYFSGASCDDPYAEDTYRGASRPQFAIHTVPSTGLDPTDPFQDAYRVFFVTDMVDGTFYWGPSDCTEIVSFPGAELYEIGSEVEASAFVEFSVEAVE